MGSIDGCASYLGPARPPSQRQPIALQNNRKKTPEKRFSAHSSAIHFETRGADRKKLFWCWNLNRNIESVRATLHSTNSLNTALHYELVFNTVYDIFNSFYVQKQTDNAIPQRKTLIGIEATVSIIYCTVRMRH